jgi:hypothetical protein
MSLTEVCGEELDILGPLHNQEPALLVFSALQRPQSRILVAD